MIVHLIDGTYELFRHFYGLRRFTKGKDRPFGAVVGVLNTVLQMIEEGATHLGVATDHVIESFRNELWSGYKTGDGIEPALLAQFHPLEDALAAMGIAVWPMIELEADDALASAAAIAARDSRVQKVCIWTPDKDLAQCVRGDRVVQVDRKSKAIRECGRRAREIRRDARADPRLSRARRRQRGRISRHRRDRRERRGEPPQPIRQDRGFPGPRFSASAASSRCSSRGSRPCAPMRRSSSASRSSAGRVRPRRFAAFAARIGDARLLGRAEKARAG